MLFAERLANALAAQQEGIACVVDFNPDKDSLYALDLSAGNPELNAALIINLNAFSNWIANKLNLNGCRYGIGGYLENRVVYAYSPIFNDNGVARSWHLGVDIWAKQGTPVYAPLDAKVHSFNNNDNPGDYGPTIILQHNVAGLPFCSLYGHLSKESIQGLRKGQPFKKGEQIATFGDSLENGGWPPHLHLQLMAGMQGLAGDYPGVCSAVAKTSYLANIADPQLLLRFPRALNQQD